MFTFIWGGLLEDVEDMFKSPKLQQNPMHHCLQGVYLDRRRIERILLSHTEPMIFDISCSLARPCQVFFDWHLQWFGVLGRASHANPMASAQSFNGWIWTTSMSGLLDCWNPAMTIGFDPNFTRKRQLTKKTLWISELIRATLFSRPKKQVPSPIYYPRLDWNPSYSYPMGDFITYIIYIYIHIVEPHPLIAYYPWRWAEVVLMQILMQAVLIIQCYRSDSECGDLDTNRGIHFPNKEQLQWMRGWWAM